MDYAFGGDNSGGLNSMTAMGMNRSFMQEAAARGPAPEVDKAILNNGKLNEEVMRDRALAAFKKKLKEGTLGKEADDDNKSENEEVLTTKDFEEYIEKFAETVSQENGEEVTVENAEDYVRKKAGTVSQENGKEVTVDDYMKKVGKSISLENKGEMTKEEFKKSIQEMVEEFRQENGEEVAVDDFRKYIKEILVISQENDQNLKADVKVVKGVNESFEKEKREAMKFAWSVWAQAFLEQLGESFKGLAQAAQDIDEAVAQVVLPDMSAGAFM